MYQVQLVFFLAAPTCLLRAEPPLITLIDNSVGISQVMDLNSHGQIIGKKEIQIGPLGLSQVPYFYDAMRETRVEILDGYTNIEPEALSDSGHVVGYVSRSIGHPQGSLQAFLWKSSTKRIIGLGTLPGHRSSHALDITQNGNLIVGYSTGADPEQMVPCMWEKNNAGWACTPLQTIFRYNPVLLASRVVVSNDGQQIAACIAVKVIDKKLPLLQSALCVWRRLADKNWERLLVRNGSYRLAGINNHGMLAGSCVTHGHRRGFVYDSANGFQLLELLEGDESGQALDLNNKGTVVGYSDDPFGPIGGPQAFVWSNGQMSALRFPVPVLYSSAQTINDHSQIGGYLETEEKSSNIVSFILSP